MKTMLLLSVLLLAAPSRASERASNTFVDISLCGTGAASPAPIEAEFNTLFRFVLDQHGAPTNIVVLLGARFIDQKAMTRCLRDWRLVGVNRSTPFTALFYWKNRVWTKAEVSGPGFRFRIRRNADTASQ